MPDKAEVDDNGLVTAKGYGEAQIHVISRDYTWLQGGAWVTIGGCDPESILVIPSSALLSILEGEYDVQLSAEVQGAGCEGVEPPIGDIEWTSSDSGVAPVTQDGLVTAAGPGQATIFAHALDLNDLAYIDGQATITVDFQCDADGDGRLEYGVDLVGSMACTAGYPVDPFFQMHCGISTCPATEGVNYVCRLCGFGPYPDETVVEARSGFCVPGAMIPCMYWGNLTPVP
jgi:hypothetical protein